MEFMLKFFLPLFDERPRANNHAAHDITAHQQFLNQQARHNRFAGSGVVSQYKAQRLLHQHFFVHCGNLMRQRLYQRRIHRQIWLEQIRNANSVGFRS